MNPYERPPLTQYEQNLRDEVIYLHSLWHQGPPTLNPNHVNYSSRYLHVANPTPFKRTNRDKHAKDRNKTNNLVPSQSRPDPHPDPDPEWPLDPPQPPPPQSGSGWSDFKSNPSPLTQSVSEADQGKFAAVKMQQKILNCCKEFLVKKSDSDADEDIESDDFSGDEDSFEDNGNDVEESKEFKFFLSLFVENQELSAFYEKNTESGDFYCLVCGGIGEKKCRIYKGCVGLVQHARTIFKTKGKRAHRAFALVICKVLGWDVSRLPMIVLKGEPLSQSLLNSGQTKAKSDGQVHGAHNIEVPNMEALREGATECMGELEKNAECGCEDSNFPKNGAEIVSGGETGLSSKKDSGIHQENCVQNTGDIVSDNVNNLEKDCIKANESV